MEKKTVFIEIEGPDAPDAADELAELVLTELGEKPLRKLPDHASPSESDGRKFDPAVVAAAAAAVSAALAIPAALIKAKDLKERLAKKERIERLVSKGRNLKERKRVSSIRFRIGPAEISFERADYAKIAEELERQIKD